MERGEERKEAQLKQIYGKITGKQIMSMEWGGQLGRGKLRPGKSDSRGLYVKCFIKSDLSIFTYKMEKNKTDIFHYVQMVCLYPFVFLPTYISIIISKLVVGLTHYQFY